MGVSADSPGVCLYAADEPLYIFWSTMRKLLTMDEASEYLGISKLTLYGWVSERKLGFIKVGRLVKFKQEHLDRWIDQHTVKARPVSQERVDVSSEH
jgi:excisionase family DNA binding protein